MTETAVHDPQIAIPIGDANVIRSLQQFLELAKEGKIISIAMVGIAADGNVYSAPVLAQNPTILHIALGALESLMIDINDFLRRFKQQMSASPIIKPNGMIR